MTKEHTEEGFAEGLVDNVMGHQRVTHIHMALHTAAVMAMAMVMMIMEATEDVVVGAWEVAWEVACLS